MSTQVKSTEQQAYAPGFHMAENYAFKSERGLSKKIVEQISEMKGEPEWMRKFRLKSLALFENRPMPTWGADLSGIDFDTIYYYIKPVAQQGKTWDDIPSDIKDTFDRLGIPQAEQKYLAGVTAQYESEAVYHKVMEGARVRYTTIQNWSKNVYNLVTKRAAAYRDATMEWVDGNLGSKVTMKYPAVLLMEPGARGDILSVAFASDGMQLDAGAKVTHLAPHTTSQILSKSVSKGTGRASYRGLVRINRGAHHTKSSVRCDALLLDENARTDTYPTIRVEENQTEIGHEATVSKVGEDQLFYLMSRGLDESEAYSLIVNGFIEPITKELPMEYAVELNRLIQLEMSGSVG